ncbi:ATP-binding cassette domain-containing protein [Streptomyces sp. NPDC051020]|uniref:ABC transporter ATP-binding protein n=1 Tax=Streptomyces sp. NPDC051020 TaxID=3155409 RepID=UPI00342E4A39
MIEAEGLVKRYGSTTAVEDLTFEAGPGRVTGFLGPNGAGKSTTMRMILGLDAPTAGLALVGGRPYRSLARPLREVGALLDPHAVHRGRSARAHLASIAASNDIPARRVDEVLEMTGLAEVDRRRVGGFSLGMKQRLGIAVALLGNPPALMLDEPVNGLDPEGVLWIRTLMRSLAAEGRTVFVSSHLMSEMALTADHLVIVGGGRLITDISTEEFIRGSARGAVLVRTADSATLTRLLTAHGAQVTPEPDGVLAVAGLQPQDIGDLAAANRLTIHELSTRQASLEEAFMDITAASVQYRAGATAGTSRRKDQHQ